jgi:Zn-dependent alcohol dehydrogenases
VRERTDWPKSVRTVEPAFRELGAPLEAVHAYTDANCQKCGSCLQGCATNAGKSTMNTYIADALARGLLELRDRASSSASCRGRDRDRRRVRRRRRRAARRARERGRRRGRRAEHAAAPAPLGADEPGDRAAPRAAPRAPRLRLFDEPQDAHMVYPITAHSMAHQHDEDGGFVIEATTIQDPIGFATTLRDENGPLWGQPLVDAVRKFRHWTGVLAMVNDENNGTVAVDENGAEQFGVDFQPSEQSRLDASLDFSREVLLAAGATRICWTGIASTHVQGSARMGDDPSRSVVDRNGRGARGEAPLRRRRIVDPTHAVGEPVAHDHGPGHTAGRPPRCMRAALLSEYHRPLDIVDRPVPEPTGWRDVVVRVGGAGVCATDLHAIDGLMEPAGLRPPVVLGHENAGWVHAVGPGVTSAAVGDACSSTRRSAAGSASRAAAASTCTASTMGSRG